MRMPIPQNTNNFQGFGWTSIILFSIVWWILGIVLTPGMLFTAIPNKQKCKTDAGMAVLHSFILNILFMIPGLYFIFLGPAERGSWTIAQGAYGAMQGAYQGARNARGQRMNYMGR